MLALGVVLAICILVALYCFQYDRTVAEVREVLVYRIFYCSSDVLRLWFDYFPAREPFVGLAGIPLTAAAAGLDYVNPTVVVPESLRTGRITSFQVGFIGSGYAFLGFLGVIIYSCLAGAIAGVIGSLQSAFRNDIGAVSFFAVLTLNVFFLTTRELHTAMLSGGTVSVLILFLSLHWLLRPYARPRRT